MAYGLNDEREAPADGKVILAQMKQRLAFLDEKIKDLVPMKMEAESLRRAITAYENQFSHR